MREWYFQVMGQELGPLTAAELKSKVESGQIQSDTMVRRGTDGKWLFAEKVKGLIPPRSEPVLPAVLAAKSKSSATMTVVEDQHAAGTGTSSALMKAVKWPEPASPARQVPVISISMESDDDADDSATAPSSEFYDFVGFREAISPVLHRAVRQYLTDNRLTMTQLNRQALAKFIARPDLAADLMISNMAVIPQVVNVKSNADRTHPLSERERAEHATFRLTLFNCSNNTLEVSQGEFMLETIEIREYDNVETKPLQALDHKGHVQVKVDGIQTGSSVALTLKATIPPLAATNVVVWFRSSSKPSLTTIRGQLKLGEGTEIALSEPLTIIMHSDSP